MEELISKQSVLKMQRRFMEYDETGCGVPCQVVKVEDINNLPTIKDSESYFVENAKKCQSSEAILNWYRNLYYKENSNTERSIVANAINEVFANRNAERCGEWIETDYKPYMYRKCSLCGRRIELANVSNHLYCPQCGAKMKEAKNE